METAFTPWTSLAGGALIGAAAVLLMAANGKILGATGVLTGAFTGGSDRWWRVAALSGMAAGPFALWLAAGGWPEIEVPVSTPMLMLGGVLVGLGVSFGAGCTSGHGVCGLARFSPRSLAATLTFMATTAATVFALRHGLGG